MITRWGTQLRALQSVLANHEAFLRYSSRADVISDDRKKEKAKVTEMLAVVHNAQFWSNLALVCTILEPLHEAQKMSEANKAHLGYVYPRWIEIRKSWETLERSGREQYRRVDWPGIYRHYEERLARQVTVENYTAWALDPTTRPLALTPNHQAQIIAFIRRYCGFPASVESVVREFLEYRSCEGAYAAHLINQELLLKPMDFWLYMASLGSQLSFLARRIYSSLANSVPSERSFSAQNLLHCRLRNRLSQEKVDRLAFIYMNYRTLNHATKAWEQLSDAEIEDLEAQMDARML